MNCNIIKDLIPLYIDGCCSDETSAEVEKHIKECRDCKAVFDGMNSDLASETVVFESKKSSRVNDWKASVLQSALLFALFLLITIGVAFESQTPSGLTNGIWAFNLVIPSTGFMLSLANWYFIKLYKSKKVFSWFSCALTVFITVGATLWSMFHYEMFDPLDLSEIFGILKFSLYFYRFGYILTFIFAVLSKTLSSFYAKMLGKE